MLRLAFILFFVDALAKQGGIYAHQQITPHCAYLFEL